MLNRKQLSQLRASSGGPNRVREAMALAGITQTRLAEGTGLDQSYISRIACGEYSRLPYNTTLLLARYFGCSTEELFPVRDQQIAS